MIINVLKFSSFFKICNLGRLDFNSFLIINNTNKNFKLIKYQYASQSSKSY